MSDQPSNLSPRDRLPDRMQELGQLLEACADPAGDFSTSVSERDILRALINGLPDQLYVKDRQSRFVTANDAVAADKFFRDGRPVTASELIGKSDFDLFEPAVAQGFRDTELAIMATGRPKVDVLELNVNIDGSAKWLLMTKLPLRSMNEEIVGLLGIGRDITARKLAEDRLEFLAHHDALTGLPNRALFADRLQQAVLHGTRNQSKVTVIFLDLDRFKLVNDSLGHEAGDKVLEATANRVQSCLRANDTVSRMGGDEFVILLPDSPQHAIDLIPVIEKIRTTIAEPFETNRQWVTVTTSMGIAIFPEDGGDPESLMRSADAAMYAAKQAGRNGFKFHSQSGPSQTCISIPTT